MRLMITIDEETNKGLELAATEEFRAPAQQAAYWVKVAVDFSNAQRNLSGMIASIQTPQRNDPGPVDWNATFPEDEAKSNADVNARLMEGTANEVAEYPEEADTRA